jgi:hypothetical protein
MCFQELQAHSALVKLNLQSLAHDGQVFTDSNADSDRVGSTIVAAPHVKVLDHGSKGEGAFVWIKVESLRGPIFVGYVYAPANRGQQTLYWQWLTDFLHTGNWFLAGILIWWKCQRTPLDLPPFYMVQRCVIGMPWWTNTTF